MEESQEKVKQRVFSVMPGYGGLNPYAAHSHYCMPSRGDVDIIPGIGISSALCFGFNKLWAQALNWAEAGMIDWFLLHHSDIHILSGNWLENMIVEATSHDAAVLSAVQAIKDPTVHNIHDLLTSTSIDRPDQWTPRKLKLSEIERLPDTFSTRDVEKISRGNLLVNTGLMLVDVRRPEFRELADDGSLFFHFRMQDRIIPHPETGERIAQFRPEDWEFSRMCHEKGLPVFATKKIKCEHRGEKGFPNCLDVTATC